MTQPMEAFKAMMGAMTLGPWNAIVSVVRHDEEAKANAAGIVASVTLAQFLASNEAREALARIIRYTPHFNAAAPSGSQVLTMGDIEALNQHYFNEVSDALLTFLAEKATAR